MKKILIRYVLKWIVENKDLLYRVLMLLAEKAVAETSNDLDDRLLKYLKASIGEQDVVI
jgi:ABC-type iron transport system FetAB permease component